MPMHASEPGRPIPDLRIVGGRIGVPWLDEKTERAFLHDNAAAAFHLD